MNKAKYDSLPADLKKVLDARGHGVLEMPSGTGKTVTLQILAQGLSDAGVSVFAADVKGDLSGIAAPGQPSAATRAGASVLVFDAGGRQLEDGLRGRNGRCV